MSIKKREYTYDEWKKAMDLHNRFKLGYRQISRILDINEKTVRNWIYYGITPPAARWVPRPSRELGYVIGVIHGDASVYKVKHRHEYKIILHAIDKEFVEVFSRTMSRLLNKKYIEPCWSRKNRLWCVEYRSKAFYTWYKKCEEQGLEGFEPYIEHNKEMVRYYLKGLFDSDGGNNGNKRIYLGNSNIQLLEYIRYLLTKYFDIKATGPYLVRKAGTTKIINGVKTATNHDCYTIYIHRKKHVQKFLREIGFSVVRRQLGLKKLEKVFVEGKYVEPYELVKLGLFKLPFSDNQ